MPVMKSFIGGLSHIQNPRSTGENCQVSALIRGSFAIERGGICSMLQMNLSNACEEYVRFRFAFAFAGRKVRRDRFWRSQRMPGFHRTRAHLCQPPATRGTDRPTCGSFAGSCLLAAWSVACVMREGKRDACRVAIGTCRKHDSMRRLSFSGAAFALLRLIVAAVCVSPPSRQFSAQSPRMQRGSIPAHR